MSSVANYEVVNFGHDASDYFQGIGTYGTNYDVATYGIGETFNEALLEAIDNLFSLLDGKMSYAEIMAISDDIEKRHLLGFMADKKTKVPNTDLKNEIFYHVGIRI